METLTYARTLSFISTRLRKKSTARTSTDAVTKHLSDARCELEDYYTPRQSASPGGAYGPEWSAEDREKEHQSNVADNLAYQRRVDSMERMAQEASPHLAAALKSSSFSRKLRGQMERVVNESGLSDLGGDAQERLIADLRRLTKQLFDDKSDRDERLTIIRELNSQLHRRSSTD